MSKPRIAFYAPIKPPDHGIASGDREIARLLQAALGRAGYRAKLVSRWISYSKKSDPARLDERRRAGREEVDRIRQEWDRRPPDERPSLFLTYHPYCKAPDLIGPPLAAEFGLPYATVEACRTNQGVGDEWRPWREIVTAGIRQAAVNFCFTPTDRRYLETILSDRGTIRDLHPFVDATAIAAAEPRPLPGGLDPDAPTLLTVGMMRPGAKMQSYEALAAALRLVSEPAWNLVIVGDGPGRVEAEALFSRLKGGTVRFLGALAHGEVVRLMASADIFVWPGKREAIGMAYLEAQAAGLPVVAEATAGVPQAVADGVSGLLSPPDDPAQMADAIRALLEARALRHGLGRAAAARIRAERDIARAAGTLDRALRPLIE